MLLNVFFLGIFRHREGIGVSILHCMVFFFQANVTFFSPNSGLMRVFYLKSPRTTICFSLFRIHQLYILHRRLIWVYCHLYMKNQISLIDLDNQPESSQDVLLLHICQHLLHYLLVRIQTSENITILPSSDLILTLRMFLMMIFHCPS